MTRFKKDEIKTIATILKDFNDRKLKADKDDGNYFDETKFLLDEFSYYFEGNPEFNETKFRQFVYDIK